MYKSKNLESLADQSTPLLDPNNQIGSINQSPSVDTTTSNVGGGGFFNNLFSQGDDIEVHKNALGTINGCYGWGVGQQGVGGVLIIFLVAEFQAILTVLSLSAMVTNGNMHGGGSYFMISRTLGPEFGGSIGILFYAAYCVGVAFYCTGFAEELVDTWYGSSDNHPWMVIGWASFVLAFALIIALLGAGWFTKINVPLFLIQAAAIFIALIAMYERGRVYLDGKCDVTSNSDCKYHHAWSVSQLKNNFWNTCKSSWGGCKTFQKTFGVLFPAATGIMEGANLSGDMRNPAYSIPVGTLSAVGTAILVYLLLIIGFGGSFPARTLVKDTTVMQEISYGDFGTYLVITGIMISASSSALGSLFGGSRVLQAIARDQLFPFIEFFGYGSPKGDEPRIAVLFTWVVAQLLCLIGSIDSIATIATAFFCLSYATVNLACFLLEVSGTPNFRPTFKYYTWHLSLLGVLSNLIVMFYVDYEFGTGALICEIAVFVFLLWRAPQNVWGDVTQSVIFHQVRKYLLRLDERKMHSKLWRPSILLYVDNNDLALIDFCNNLKKGGLYVVGTVLEGNFEQFADKTAQIRNKWLEFIDTYNIKAFPQISIAPTARIGYENILLLCGLGAMQPNIVVLPLINVSNITSNSIKSNFDTINEKEEKEQKDNEISVSDVSSVSPKYRKKTTINNRRLSVFNELPNNLKKLVVDSPSDMNIIDYVTLLENILKIKKNIIVTHNFDKMDHDLIFSKEILRRYKSEQKNRNIKITDKEEIEEEEEEEKQDNKLSTTKSFDIEIQKDDSQQKLIATTDNNTINSYQNEDNSLLSSTGFDFKNFANKFGVSQPKIDNKFVDVWIFASDYTYNISNTNDINSFPMLIMQLAHILLLNKKWSQQASLRVFLITPSSWDNEKDELFESICRKLRLKINTITPLTQTKMIPIKWIDIIKNKKSKSDMRKYYRSLNEKMISLSSKTHFIFMKLPQLPNKQLINNENLYKKYCNLYFECLYILTNSLPPTALVKTGETLPVISVDI